MSIFNSIVNVDISHEALMDMGWDYAKGRNYYDNYSKQFRLDDIKYIQFSIVHSHQNCAPDCWQIWGVVQSDKIWVNSIKTVPGFNIKSMAEIYKYMKESAKLYPFDVEAEFDALRI